MTINEKLDKFLREAQAKIALLGKELDEIVRLGKVGSYAYIDRNKKIWMLIAAIEALYHTKALLKKDGVQVYRIVSWRDQEISLMIDYLTSYCDLQPTTVPFHLSYIPINTINGTTSGDVDLPTGAPGQIAVANSIGGFSWSTVDTILSTFDDII